MHSHQETQYRTHPSVGPGFWSADRSRPGRSEAAPRAHAVDRYKVKVGVRNLTGRSPFALNAQPIQKGAVGDRFAVLCLLCKDI